MTKSKYFYYMDKFSEKGMTLEGEFTDDREHWHKFSRQYLYDNVVSRPPQSTQNGNYVGTEYV